MNKITITDKDFNSAVLDRDIFHFLEFVDYNKYLSINFDAKASWTKETGWQTTYKELGFILLISEISNVLMSATSSWEDLGMDLAYLFAAISQDGRVDWGEKIKLVQFLQEHFEPEHPIWGHINLKIYGTVSYYDEEIGFGYIMPDVEFDNQFGIDEDGFVAKDENLLNTTKLKEGQEVSFIAGAKGSEAIARRIEV